MLYEYISGHLLYLGPLVLFQYVIACSKWCAYNQKENTFISLLVTHKIPMFLHYIIAYFKYMCLLYAYEKNKVISCRLSKSRLEEIRIAPMGDESKKYLIQLHKLRPRQNGRHFADDIFICIFLNENIWIAIKISTKFVPEGPINNIPTLVQIMAWRRIGDKPLSEAMVVEFADAYMRHSASVSKKAIREVKLSYLPRMRYAESVNLEVWLKNVCNFRTKSSHWWPFLLNFSSGMPQDLATEVLWHWS